MSWPKVLDVPASTEPTMNRNMQDQKQLLADQQHRPPCRHGDHDYLGDRICVDTRVMVSGSCPKLPIMCGNATFTTVASIAARKVPIMTDPATSHLPEVRYSPLAV